jgi:hypothetical protein
MHVIHTKAKIYLIRFTRGWNQVFFSEFILDIHIPDQSEYKEVYVILYPKVLTIVYNLFASTSLDISAFTCLLFIIIYLCSNWLGLSSILLANKTVAIYCTLDIISKHIIKHTELFILHEDYFDLFISRSDPLNTYQKYKTVHRDTVWYL